MIEEFKQPENNAEAVPNLEQKEIMEHAANERAKTVQSYLGRLLAGAQNAIPPSARKAVMTGINMTPVADIKMFIEGARGSTFGGKELSSVNRLLYAVSALMSGLGKVAVAYGAYEGNEDIAMAGGASWSSSYVPFGYIMLTESWDIVRTFAVERKLDSVLKLMDWVDENKDMFTRLKSQEAND